MQHPLQKFTRVQKNCSVAKVSLQNEHRTAYPINGRVMDSEVFAEMLPGVSTIRISLMVSAKLYAVAATRTIPPSVMSCPATAVSLRTPPEPSFKCASR